MSDEKPTEERQSHEIPLMSEDKLREFVLDYCDGHIYTSIQIKDPERDLKIVFAPIVWGAFEGWTEEEAKQIGCIWEHLNKRGKWSVNGMPTFFSLNLMHIKDWERARKAINAELERRKTIPV